jgi:hypothetical protein
MNNNQALENFFWMPFRRRAKEFAGIQNGGRFMPRRCAVAAFSRFPVGCCIANYRIAFKLSPCIIAAAGRMAGKTA